jgi:hypothetical protein
MPHPGAGVRSVSAPTADRAARQAWLGPGLVTAAFAGVLAWAALESEPTPIAALRGPHWWQRALLPTAHWTLPLLAAIWAVTLVAYWWPRRGEGVNMSLVTLLSMTVVGSGLGSAAFFPCAAGQAPVIAPLSWVMILFTGSLEPRFGPDTSCPGQLPLALQFARLLCLGATFIGVVAAVTVLWRTEIERFKTHFVSELTVLTGLDAMTLALLRELVTRSPGRKVVIIESDPGHPMLEEARATGARVIIGDPASPEDLRHVLTHRGRSSARTLFALHASAVDNEEILRGAQQILGGAVRDTDHDPHLVARIDDPRHADTWRGDHIGADEPWLDDALSPYETTALNVVGQALGRQPQTLIVCGDTTLALAILIETARTAWEQAGLAAARRAGQDSAGLVGAGLGGAGLGGAGQSGAGQADQAAQADAGAEPDALEFPVVRVLDAHAADLKREFAATAPAALQAALGDVGTESRPWHTELLSYLDTLGPDPAAGTVIIVTDEPTAAGVHEAGRVARLHPRTALYFRSEGRVGVPEGVFDGLRYYQPGFLVGGDLPDDTWTRLARHNHETYRLRRPGASDDSPARQPWESLSEFFREENIRQIRQVLSGVVGLGRRWRPLRVLAPGSMVQLNQTELTALAQAEHERWYARRLAAGWRAPRDGEPPGHGHQVNPNVLPWAELTTGAQDGNVANVESILGSLEAIGYVPALPDDGPEQAQAFLRHGEVRAVRLRAPGTWRAAGGAAMRARLGDWHIRDEQGDERTAADRPFRASHRFIASDRWARIGQVRAWQVSEATVIRTLEGPVEAQPGDWIVQGTHGERWPVPAARFTRVYRAAGQR